MQRSQTEQDQPATGAQRRRTRRPPRWLAPLLLVTILAAGQAPAAAPAAAQTTSLTYELVDTWANVPHQAAAGLFVAPRDITSGPDGSIYVPDTTYRDGIVAQGIARHQALHVLEREGTARALWDMSPSFDVLRRVDTHTDGAIWALGDPVGPTRQGVARLTPDGDLTMAWPLVRPQTAVDVAMGPDGSVYVSYAGPPGLVVRHDPDGTETLVLDPVALGVNGQPDPFQYVLGRLDVAADGRVYVLSTALRDCPPEPPPPPPPPPRPTPTPRPSFANAPVAPHQDELPCRKEAVLVFGADGKYERQIPWPHQGDVASGAAGTFLARNEAGGPDGQETWLYHVDREVPALQLRMPERKSSIVGFSGPEDISADIGSDGRADGVAMAADPFYRGAFTFGHPGTPKGDPLRRQWALGLHDQPPLASPGRPARIGAGDEVVLLGLSYTRDAGGHLRTAAEPFNDVSTVQRWRLDGRPVWQVTHAGFPRPEEALTYNADGPLVDVALDDGGVFTVSDTAVWYRPDALSPTWYRRTFGTRFIAAASDAGRLALLDVSGERVFVMDRSGALLGSWSTGGTRETNAPADLALAGDRVYLADQGRNRVLVRAAADGELMAEWPTHDGPWRIAMGPEGDVYILGRGGWGLRYHPDGSLVATWRLPFAFEDVPVAGQDIAVGNDARVYVPFVGLAATGSADGLGERIDASGVWVFVPRTLEPPAEPPETRSCLAVPDKRARPSPLLVGETVDVTLTVAGRCPGTHIPHQVMLVLDTSWSMDDEYPGNAGRAGGLRKAKALLDPVLAALDPTLVDVGLVTFNNGGELHERLTSDISAVRAAIARLMADGDTRMGAGIDLARQELTGARGKPGSVHTILLVSDGVFKDDPAGPIARAQADGIDVRALVLSTPEFTPDLRAALEEMLADPLRLTVDPPPEAAEDILRGTAAYIPNPWLFRQITVLDEVPDDFAYVAGSSQPPALWDAATRTLRWDVADVLAADGLQLIYRLTAHQPGDRPTNIRAVADYSDGLDQPGQLTFPVPRVYVLRPDPLATPTNEPTATATPVPPTPTATPVPRTHIIYLSWAGKQACFVGLKPLDIVLVHDHSSTMGEPAGNGGGNKLDRARAAARTFVGLAQWHKDRIGVVEFDATADWLIGLSNRQADVEMALDALEVGWGTRIDRGLMEARHMLAQEARAEALPVVVLLSDGLQNGVADPVVAEMALLKQQGAVVYTIALGANADTGLMRDLATSPEHAYVSPSVADLANIYAELASVIQPCEGP